MSHIATVKLAIKDLGALERACQKVGFTFLRGQTQHTACDNMGRKTLHVCTHAIKTLDTYFGFEIGLIAQKDGSFILQCDDMMMETKRSDYILNGGGGGVSVEKLTQAYGAEVAVAEAALTGWSNLSYDWDKEGNIVVNGVQY